MSSAAVMIGTLNVNIKLKHFGNTDAAKTNARVSAIPLSIHSVNDQHIIQGKLFIPDKGKLSVLHCIHELLLLF